MLGKYLYMTDKQIYLEFLSICGSHLIDPLIALEIEGVKEALSQHDLDAIDEILAESI
jgi:hypothetical protein